VVTVTVCLIVARRCHARPRACAGRDDERAMVAPLRALIPVFAALLDMRAEAYREDIRYRREGPSSSRTLVDAFQSVTEFVKVLGGVTKREKTRSLIGSGGLLWRIKTTDKDHCSFRCSI
jgi:hypothetical protein